MTLCPFCISGFALHLLVVISCLFDLSFCFFFCFGVSLCGCFVCRCAHLLLCFSFVSPHGHLYLFDVAYLSCHFASLFFVFASLCSQFVFLLLFCVSFWLLCAC